MHATTKAATPTKLAIILDKDDLQVILSHLCKEAFKKYKMEHIFMFNGVFTPDASRSGEKKAELGIECVLDFKPLGSGDNVPMLLPMTDHGPVLYFREKDLNEAIISYAQERPAAPRGANVNMNSTVRWMTSDPEGVVEVIMKVTYDDSSDHQ